jgi:hypothetical protein
VLHRLLDGLVGTSFGWSPLTRMRRFVCVLTASKGVVSGSGMSIVVGKVAEIYGVRMHETLEMSCLTVGLTR